MDGIKTNFPTTWEVTENLDKVVGGRIGGREFWGPIGEAPRKAGHSDLVDLFSKKQT